MKKNVAGQIIGAQLVSATDGSAVTSGTTTVYRVGDGGAQASIGTATHEGQGYWSISPSQANTNFDHIAFTFVNSSAVSATVQVFTSFPQSQDHAFDITAILADTNELQGNQGDWATATGFATVNPDNASISAILTNTGTTIPAQISALNNLSSADVTAVVPTAAEIEAAIINEGDGQAVLQAILDKINNDLDVSGTELSAIAGAVRTELATELARIDVAISTRSTFDPALDTVSRVTLVDTTTVNTDMRGTDGALTAVGYTPPDNASIAAILTDTSTTIPAQISALNDFDPSSDVVARVTLVDTTTANTDMRGTDNAPTLSQMTTAFTEIKGSSWSSATDTLEAIRDRGDAAWVTGGAASAPTAAEIRAEIDANSTQLATILADTNELQSNQGNWITATGFATETKQDVIDANVDAIKLKTDDLTFTTANVLDANIQYVNDVAVTGTGAEGDEWGP